MQEEHGNGAARQTHGVHDHHSHYHLHTVRVCSTCAGGHFSGQLDNRTVPADRGDRDFGSLFLGSFI